MIPSFKHKESGASGPWLEAWKRFRKNRLALIGLILFALILLGIIWIPILSPYTWNQVDGSMKYAPPSAAHWFGTMRNGNDLFVNIWYGGRESLLYALVATVVYLFTGTMLGLWAGYHGKKVDFFLNHIMDFVHALPHIPILMVGAIGLTAREWRAPQILLVAMVTYGFLSSPVLFKVIRSQVISIKSQEFMHAAQILGLSKRAQVYGHILPNVLTHVVVALSLMISQAILIELMLFFIGIGYRGGEFTPMKPTWGNLIPNIRGFDAYKNYHWLTFFPIMTIIVVTSSLKLIGEGLREALDPKSQKMH
jgi:peptide/nickel transport system permease protein